MTHTTSHRQAQAVDEKSVKKSIKTKIQFAVLAGLMCIFGIFIYSQLESLRLIESEKAAVQRNIEIEKAVKANLENESEYSRSEEFIEKVVRERFGWVKEGDILFIPR